MHKRIPPRGGGALTVTGHDDTQKLYQTKQVNSNGGMDY